MLLAIPNVVGQNAAVAADNLKRAGFTNVGFGTVDGRAMVVLPENWTVKTQSAQPGDHLPANAKIVLGCARNG
jgi:beta-lactam-binding protein with PASTA domain